MIRRLIEVALLLPLGTGMPDPNYMDFYFGAQLALRDLTADSLDVHLSVLNVSDSLDRTRVPEAMRQSDVILGPFSQDDILSVLDSLPEDKFIVSPLDPRTAGLAESHRVILANTPVLEQVRDAAAWCWSQQDTIIVVSETGGRLTPVVNEMRAQFDTTVQRNVIAVDYSFIDGLTMSEWFAVHTHLPDTNTRFFVCSDRDIFVKDIIRNANVQIGFGKSVDVYGPAKARSGEIAEVCGANVHASTTFHADYSDSATVSFVKDYRALYSKDPGQYAFHGYDTMKYFTQACALFGPQWGYSIHGYGYSGLQTSFDFLSYPDREGYVNEAVRRVLYSGRFNSTIVKF